MDRKRKVIYYIVFIVFLLSFSPLIAYFGLKPNTISQRYEKKFEGGNGYLQIEFRFEEIDNEKLSYDYYIILSSSGNVNNYTFTRVDISFYLNNYLIDSFNQTFGQVEYSIGRGGSSLIDLNSHDNFTIIGAVGSIFCLENECKEEKFDVNYKYEYIDLSWLRDYGFVFIIIIVILIVIIFSIVIYYFGKRSNNKI